MSVEGTPSACLLPARMHKFSYVTDLMSLEVPTRGEFPTDVSVSGVLSYDICPGEGQILFGTLLQALFAFKQYPALEDNQHFVIVAVETSGDTVHVVGRVIEGITT